ncbi:hypothetical protein [Aquisediminimonas sediminicola]|uniref:hypothetical protein n=1 Tax=Alteraquisediminimonas sediminicola TaxID=2676787 RepID=UPI001C8ECC01|nr:hypothetical protein [Aquisediminimonas sediminicola]
MIEPITIIEGMNTDQRDGALTMLDHISRPLTVREIEGALRLHGVPKSRAVIIAASIKKLGVIAIVGGENG